MIQDRVLPALRRGAATFGSFSAGQKAATICTIIALAVGGFLFSRWASEPTYAPLFNNLSSQDANAIVQELQSTGVKYKLADGGQTILVPQDLVYDTRLTMSGAGLPSGGDTGYALLDKQGLTTSEFMQQVGYQRALEGELSNTIKSIDGVQGATVHLALPQKDVFADEKSKPTASVLVTNQPGQELTSNQVQAIVHLVSSSVVDLDTTAVTVSNAAGTILTDSSAGGGAAGGGGSQDQQTQKYEQRLNGSLQQMLNQVVGAGHAVVTVTANLDYDSSETKSETYVTTPGLPPVSSTTSKEAYTGSGNASGGVLGPDNVQVPDGNVSGSSGTGSGNGDYEKTSTTLNNAIGRVTKTTTSAPGAVKKLSVAVLLDSRTAGSLDTAKVQQLVSSAVGLDAKRGDTIAVSALPFDQTAAEAAKTAEKAATAAGKQTQLIGYAKTGAMVFALLLLFFGAWRSSRKKRAAGLTDDEKAQLEEMQAALESARTHALEAGAGQNALALSPPEPRNDTEREDRQQDLLTLVERQPEEVAQLLRGWLADRRG